MKRIAIIIERNQSPGQIGNISAILMGESSLIDPDIFCKQPILDKNGAIHSGIQYSTVVLKAGAGQLLSLIEQAKAHSDNVGYVVFTNIGQSLHNEFEEYKKQLSEKTTEESNPVGVCIFGEEEIVKQLTKKFSLIQ